MATEAQLLTALKNADAAGDTDAARKLAAAVLSVRQQPAAPQQDERSFPRAIADVGASFVGAVPKAAGAFVGLGSLSPITAPVADPISQGLMKAGAATDEMLLSDTQKQKNAAVSAALADAVRELGSDAEWTEKLAYVMEQGGVAAQTIKEDPSQIAMLTSQALPYMIGGGAIGRLAKATGLIKNPATAAALGEGSIAAGAVAADIVAQLEAKGIEGYTPERLAALPAGAVTALIGRLGAKVNTKLGTTDIDTALVNGVTGGTVRGLSPKGTVIGGGVEMGEEFLQSAQEQAFTNVGADEPVYEGVGPAAVQGAAAGFGMGSVMGSNVFNRDGSPRNPTDLQIAQRAAAGEVARSLRKTAEDNEYNLGDIDPTSGYGAKQALEDYRRGQVTGIVNLVKSLKSQLDPKQAQTLEQLLQDYVPAEAGITASKRKVSAKVTTDQFDAVKRLVAGTQEGDTLLQELQKSNIVTDLFKDGMKGGVSKFTDLFNPLMTGGQSYDPTRVGNVVVGGLPLLSTGGASLIPQAAIVLGGQAIDKVLGGKGGTRRKLVERFVKLNEGNDGLGRPTGPSLIAQAQQAELDEAQEAENSKIRKQQNTDAFNKFDGTQFDGSPLGTLYLGTGLNRAGLEALLAHIEQHYSDRPAVPLWVDETRRNLAGEYNEIDGINEWIGALNGVLSTDARLDSLRVNDPDGNDASTQRRLAGFGPSTAQSSAGTAQQQPQGRSPAEQSGIDANNALADRLLNGMTADQSIPETQKGLLRTALEEFGAANSGGNIGANGQPLQNALDIVERLRASGVMPRYINDYIMPYVQRVAQQEAGRSARGQQQQQPPSTGTDLSFDEDFDASKPALTDNVPTGEVSGTPLENSLARSFDFARRKVYTKGRDFKLDLQAKSLASQKSAGIDLTQVNPENIDRLADFVYADALEAIKDNQNAIGWYDRTVTEAIETLGEVYPEVLTSPKNKLQFVWALAVTSNGLKVDKNFELAAQVYETLQRTGRFPTDAGIGTAAQGINAGLQMYHTMLDKFDQRTNSKDPEHEMLADFMNSQVTVRDLEKKYGVKITGEGKGTLVRGASILGPKIGNGFFSNLYGNFDALTMDRWLMRTVGRWRGTLVVPNPAMEKKKRGEIKDLINGLSNTERKSLRKLYADAPVTIKPKMSETQLDDFAAATAKLSMDPEWRKQINTVSPEIRKSGNGLAGYLDGQQEAPKGAAERTFIRDVFTRALDRLQQNPEFKDITMSDLQALLWYPEKRLYDTAKQNEGDESRGYEDDEAPDYANAARKIVNLRKADTSGSGLGPLSGDGRGGRGPAGPNAGQSFDQDLAQQGNTGVLATPPAQPPQPQSPFNMASLVNKMLGSQPATPDQVKAQLPFVRPAFEIGKAGTKYADGIQDIDAALQLSKALNVSVRLFDSQQEMFDDMGRPLTENAKGIRGAYSDLGRTVWGMNAGAQAETLGDVNDLYALTTVLHELGHAAAKDSGFESVIDRMMQDNSEYSGSVRKRVYKEIDNIQKNIDLYVEKNPKQRRPVRRVMAALQARKDDPTQTPRVNRFLDYINQADERAVDPVLLYFVNPRLAKAVAPTTSRLVKENLNASGNPDLKLHAYPFATIVAVVLAMMLNGRAEEEEEEEQQRQQMPAGALSPQAGALSPQQQQAA